MSTMMARLREIHRGRAAMAMALDPGDRPINLLIASGAMPIPRNHPAYSDHPDSPRGFAARRRSATLAMIAGLLSIAAFSGGTAHYMLRFAEPGGAAPLAVIAKLPDPPAVAPSLAGASPSVAPSVPDIAPATGIEGAETAVSAEPPILPRAPAKRSIRTRKLLALAKRQKPANMLDGDNLAFVPHEEFVPAPMLPPRQPFLPTPKADR
jgi:hypothetical protein